MLLRERSEYLGEVAGETRRLQKSRRYTAIRRSHASGQMAYGFRNAGSQCGRAHVGGISEGRATCRWSARHGT